MNSDNKIPTSLSYFEGCSSLTSVEFPKSITIKEYIKDINFDSDNEIIENNIDDICSIFYDKWKNYSEEELLNSINKENFLDDIESLFTLMDKYFASEEALKEVEISLKEDPEDTEEIEEYITFTENIKVLKDIRSYFADEKKSIYFAKMKECIEYLKNKKIAMDELTDEMEKLGNKLDSLTSLLTDYANTIKEKSD